MDLKDRLVRYDDLRPCYTAFIDTRSPGSDKKENFTVIGPGVSENPDQHVHIALAHGFNIGGARQPPGCLNSQHSHLTNEVFVVHSGTWAFRSGVDATDGEVILSEGDVISLPTDVFRGFENVGDGLGYLYAILGKDDPGRVTWAPQVFDLAEDHGLVLMEDGSLVDFQAGEVMPMGIAPMSKTSAEQVAQHRFVDSAALTSITIAKEHFVWSRDTTLSDFDGVAEAALLGPANEAERIPEGQLSWPHGFVLRALRLAPGAEIPPHRRSEEEVIFVQEGGCTMTVEDKALKLRAGDTFTTPIESCRSFRNAGETNCILYITRRHDLPARPEFI